MQTYVEALEAMNVPTHDDGLAAYCEFREHWELETDCGLEYVPTDVTDLTPAECPAGRFDDPSEDDAEMLEKRFADYIEGREIHSGARVSRWCAYWSMPGYLDRGSDHCADTEAEAIAELLTYDGTNGPLGDGVSRWEYDALYRLAELADGGDTLAIETMRHNGIVPASV